MMRTVQEQWNNFANACVPEGATAVQVSSMRLSFYAGAEAILRILYDVGGEDVSEDAGIEIMSGLKDECNAFATDYALSKGVSQSEIDKLQQQVKGLGPK